MRKIILLLAATALAVLFAALPAQAATTFTVNTTTDASDANTTDGVCATAAGQCTLRAAIEQANALAGGDVIGFAPSVRGTIVLGWEGSELAITSNLKINGPGADVLSVSADDPAIPFAIKRVFSVGSGTTAEISGLTISGGYCVGGCGIRNEGTLTVSDSAITNNTAKFSSSSDSGDGGGIYNLGTLMVQRSTISDNTADDSGGGIYSKTQPLLDDPRTGYVDDGATLTTKTTITNSTISGNTQATCQTGVCGGGGVYNEEGLTEIEHSTITNNSALSGTGSGVATQGHVQDRTDVFSSIISGNLHEDVQIIRDSTLGFFFIDRFRSLGYNLIGDGNATARFNQSGDQIGVADPGLEPLSLIAPGSTKTHALKASSLAIDAGAPSTQCPPPATDQRGVARPQQGRCDIGSFERDTTAPSAPVIISPAEGAYLNVRSFAVSGSAEAGAMVELFGGGVFKGKATANSSGQWSIGLEGVTDGLHSYKAQATDASGNVSAGSAARNVTVDTKAPEAPVIIGPPDGSYDTDGRFNISGTAEPSSAVELFDGGEPLQIDVLVPPSGQWDVDLPLAGTSISEGSHPYTAKAIDRAGNVSAESQARMVIMDTIKPSVISVTPAHLATDVAPGANVTATFSEKMNASTLTAATFKLYEQKTTKPIAATVSYDPATNKATLDPSANLKGGAAYTATVTTGVTDLAGHALAAEKVWNFTVKKK